MTGLKFKIAHKRAGSEKWSATPGTQRKRMIMFLRSVIDDLEKQNVNEQNVVAKRGTPAPGERRTARAARPIAKRATRGRRAARRVPPQRQAKRSTRVHRARRSSA